MAKLVKAAAGSGLGLLLATALTAVWLRYKDQPVPEDKILRIKHLVSVINSIMTDPGQSTEAAALSAALTRVHPAGIQPVGLEWGYHFRFWEIWGLRFLSLGKGRPSQDSLQAMDDLINKIEAAIAEAGIDIGPFEPTDD